MINTRLELSDILDKLMAYVHQVVPQMESSSIMLWDVAEMGYRFIYTWGLDSDAEQLVTGRSFAADEFPLMQKMMNAHRPMIIADVDKEALWIRTNEIEQIRSYMGAPIIVQGDCIGFFHLNSTVVGAFNEHDAIRLQTFADKTGTAILSVRYAQELEELVKERTLELQKERERITSILETTGEGILYVEDYEIKFANQMAANITGYSIEELIGMDPRKFRPDDMSQEELDMLNKIPSEIKVGIPWRAELRQKHKDGTIFHVGITNSRLAGASKDVYYSVILMRDISQEKALENAKSRFIANAAHELRSPITSLKTRMYMIAKQPENIDYHINRLDRIVERMNHLVSDLLDMSYFEHGQVTLRPENIILQDVVERIANILEPEAQLEGLRLLRQVPEDPIHIWADVHRIEQVLTNLIANAIHYTPQKGSICVICSLDMEQKRAIIRVEDTGEGIPQEQLDNIFEAFYRLDNNMEKKGTGLGLSISREIVELHEGTIHAERIEGEGTVFIVSLPLLEA
jgi:PAS domain S-box-containing protein